MRMDWLEIEFDPENSNEEMWRMYHSYRRARWEERGDPDAPYIPNDSFPDTMRAEFHDQDWAHYHVVVREGDRIIAGFRGAACQPGTPNHVTNGHILRSSAGVLRPWRRRGLGRRWLAYTLRWMPLTGATTLTVRAFEPDGHAFMRAICGEPKQLTRHSRTDFRELDWDMIGGWMAEAVERATGYELEVHERRLPEAAWPEYCEAMEEFGRHIPLGELNMGDWRFAPEMQAEVYAQMDLERADHHVVCVRDPHGAIVALTDAAWYPFAPEQLQQNFTGVHPDARGMGLGKLIKARMLLLARDRYAAQGLRWVCTDNATTNAAMLGINERLGFKEHEVWGTYQASRDQVERFLAP